ncbi:camp independent regulatory protein [Pyrenochaeta sp. MPI-SDFR-AT-0127]|nr:camp independent regulatory protein [Pyrenochaeta sp. MPI-SDFR-AT-0127]
MPSFGHDLSLGGVQKVESYSDADSWSWPQHSASQHPSYSNVFDPAMYASFTPPLQPPSRGPPRHHSIATSHVLATGTNTPPPARPQVAGNMVKAQPAFKPTWQGFLDTTKDAMTIVEASLQGRLSHISRRPHDKERAEMLTSGTVLVYEENASGIKRWTDAVHWSPSRVMNNCLIYRQLVRALKPEEKKTALNPSCGTKRKRKESAGPAMTKTGDNLNNSDDEYENPSFDGSLPGDADSLNKVYANFAQSLTPDQQRRFCGSLIDSYEFKEGGLMKKTISVKYQGTHHHIISYYSLEDVVSGKLKRPFQDPKLADIQPRPELLNGWKVSLEDEESKDMPLVAGYPHHIQPSHLQHHVIGAVTQATYGPPQYPAAPYPQSYYVTDAKYVPEQKHAPNPHHGY